MKKILLLLAFTGLLFTGCKKSDSTDTSVSTKLIGKWHEGPSLNIYYTAGKEVYRETTPAVSGAVAYDEFRTGGILADYTLIGNSFFEIDGTYTLLNNNTTLRITFNNQNQDYTISFIDNNTLSMKGTSTTNIIYYKNGVSYNADSETVDGTIIRM